MTPSDNAAGDTTTSAAAPRNRPLLSPMDRAGEVIVGIIMTLSVTAVLKVGSSSGSEPHNLLMAALACNFAWGMVDAAMFLIETRVQRLRARRLQRQLREAPDDTRFRALLADTDFSSMAEALDAQALGRLRAWLQQQTRPLPTRLDRDNLLAAGQIWLLVFAATLPVAAPLLLFDDATTALRVSQAVAVAMLFGLGMGIGRWIGVRPVRAGLGFAAVGSVIAVACVALGG